MKLKEPVEYHSAPYGKIATIPAGTRLEPASNLPKRTGHELYWASGWRGMDKKARSWKRSYGFLIEVPHSSPS